MTEQQLYIWMLQQRTLYNKGMLEPRRLKLLESISGWTWDTREDSWSLQYELTKKYGIVKVKFVTPDGIRLGCWQRHMRESEKNGNASIMTPERKKLLENIPGWIWDKEDFNWTEKYKLSLKYGVVAQKFVTPDGIKLGQWQSVMRRKGGVNESVTPERRKLLEKIPGWLWRLPNQGRGITDK